MYLSTVQNQVPFHRTGVLGVPIDAGFSEPSFGEGTKLPESLYCKTNNVIIIILIIQKPYSFLLFTKNGNVEMGSGLVFGLLLGANKSPRRAGKCMGDSASKTKKIKKI